MEEPTTQTIESLNSSAEEEELEDLNSKNDEELDYLIEMSYLIV
jgi:hypothetical protein